MKHLQKLPRNEGDNILLGTIVAVGIKPDTQEFFVSFDSNGELVSYLIDNATLGKFFVSRFTDNIFNLSWETDTDQFNELNGRDDLKYEKLNKQAKVSSLTDPEDYSVFPDKNKKK